MEAKTHAAVDPALSGRIAALEPGRCTLELLTLPCMAADDTGLVHGGFVFSAADHAAMLAVNEPNVVLAAAQVQFLKPFRVGETLRIEARVTDGDGRKPTVEALARDSEGVEVFKGTFHCAVPSRHVLTPRPA